MLCVVVVVVWVAMVGQALPRRASVLLLCGVVVVVWVAAVVGERRGGAFCRDGCGSSCVAIAVSGKLGAAMSMGVWVVVCVAAVFVERRGCALSRWVCNVVVGGSGLRRGVWVRSVSSVCVVVCGNGLLEGVGAFCRNRC